MTIKKFLILFFIIGMTFCSYFSFKYIKGKKIEFSSEPLTGFYISNINCSSYIRESSYLEVYYNNTKYNVNISKDKCSDLKKGIINAKLYYDKENDKIFLEGQYFPLPYVLLCNGIVIFLTLLGFIVYRKELGNHYSSM